MAIRLSVRRLFCDKIPDPPILAPTVLGVDEFAKRRGHKYATILVDMDTHGLLMCSTTAPLMI